MRRRDRREQGAVLVRQNLRKTLGRGKPPLGAPRFRLKPALRDRHRARLHVLVGGDSDLEGFHGHIPFSRRTASTADQKSARSLAASFHSYGSTVFSRCFRSNVEPGFPPGPDRYLTGCALSNPTKHSPSDHAASASSRGHSPSPRSPECGGQRTGPSAWSPGQLPNPAHPVRAGHPGPDRAPLIIIITH